MFLPVLTLSIVGVASSSRYTRSSAIEGLTQDDICTVRVKGATNRGILFGHMFREYPPPECGEYAGNRQRRLRRPRSADGGGQSSLEIGLVAALWADIFGVAWGAIAGYFGGFIDSTTMRIVDALLALPVLFVLSLMAAIIEINQLNLTLVVAFFAWLVPARLIRGETLTLRTREYIQAVKGMGGGSNRSIFVHIIPSAIGIIVVNITFQVADALLALAAFGYLGFGLPPPAANWGLMLSQGVGYLYAGEWWLIYPVGILIVVTVIAFNFVGDVLRDAFDVRLKRR